MVGRGRIAQSVKRPSRRGGKPRASFFLRSFLFAGAAASALGAGYWAVHQGYADGWLQAAYDLREQAAGMAGFGVNQVAVSGNRYLSPDDILAVMGVESDTSLLFLDVVEARNKLLAMAWIAEANVQKLYPDRLHISIVERVPFALWQRLGKIQMISEDGTVIGPLKDQAFASLPLVVGQRAEVHARHILSALDRHPSVKEKTRAAVFVAERRWNLRLKNGLDVKLPETGLDDALHELVRLDQTKGLLSKDVAFVDLRIPDKVSVRLNEAAAKEREEALKDKKKRKGGDA